VTKSVRHRQTFWIATFLVTLSCSVMAAASQVSIATQLKEVHRGTVDGRDILTLHIVGQAVGPAACRSNTLRVDTGSFDDINRQEEIETVALSAMLSSESVVITVSLDGSECIDGKPTFTDLYVLPHKI